MITSDPAVVDVAFDPDPPIELGGRVRPLTGPRAVLADDRGRYQVPVDLFAGESLAAFGEAARRAVSRHLDRSEHDPLMRSRPAMEALALEVALASLFGLDDVEELHRARAPLIALKQELSRPLRQLQVAVDGAWTLNPRSRVRQLHDEASAVIHAQMCASRRQGRGLLAAALRPNRSAGPFRDEWIRDEVQDLLLSSQEVTAGVLTRAVQLLAGHRQHLAAVTEAVRDGELRPLERVIREAVRLWPDPPLVGRYLTHAVEAGSATIPAGVYLAVALPLLHGRADLYPDPTAFRPDRFLGSDGASPGRSEPAGIGLLHPAPEALLIQMKQILSALLAHSAVREGRLAGRRPHCAQAPALT